MNKGQTLLLEGEDHISYSHTTSTLNLLYQLSFQANLELVMLWPVDVKMQVNISGAPNDGIFPNASEVSEMYHSVLGKPV